MRNKAPAVMLVYGLLLVGCGIIGYLYHPPTAISALLSGGASGFLVLVLAWQLRMKAAWAYPAAVSASAAFVLLYGQRVLRSWEFASSPEAGTLIFVLSAVMCLASVAALTLLWVSKRP